ncbi:MAG: S-layer homology domain-containing protein [Deltaproteobacteria bacterium]|nr:S-layer homology domain-containing protein [Deltaproteobacteria bacterium]MBZ0218910.1 S-layer homology domain-containing protein [Deltaproteobacteria bacterium]
MRWFAVLFLVSSIFAVSGCSKPEMRCTSPEDNPMHHYLAGMELLEKGKTDAALEKFSRASLCDDRYSQAHSGTAIAAAMKAGAQKDEEYRRTDIKRINEHLEKARKSSSSPESSFTVRLAEMRIAAALKEKNWLKEAETSYRAALRLKVKEGQGLVFYQGREAADYFMGAAYLEAREFQPAAERFKHVLDSKGEGKWHGPADQAWKRTDKIVRALSGVTFGDVGKEIALRDTVSRAGMAALIIDELKAEKLFEGRIPIKSKEAGFIPADMLGSPLKEEVSMLVRLGVRGLEPVYDETTRAYLFRPEEPLKRKELALALEDIVIKLSGDEKIATAFLGHRHSPFPDVEPSSPWYNAIMSVTTRGLMETALSGEFRPDEYVDGAEAIMAVRTLKHHLNVH